MAKCKRNRNRAKRNFTVKTPTANRNYKDTVFRMLFSDRKNLLSLYNAVNQSDYKNPEESGNCDIRKCYLYGDEKRSGIYYGYQFISV